MNLYIGQKLRCLNGEYVTIHKLFEDTIVVKYKEKLYSRPNDIIGQKLFILTKDIHVCLVTELNQEKEMPIKEYTCNDCMLNKRGDCFGQIDLCNYFKPGPSLSKEELDSLPKHLAGPVW